MPQAIAIDSKQRHVFFFVHINDTCIQMHKGTNARMTLSQSQEVCLAFLSAWSHHPLFNFTGMLSFICVPSLSLSFSPDLSLSLSILLISLYLHLSFWGRGIHFNAYTKETNGFPPYMGDLVPLHRGAAFSIPHLFIFTASSCILPQSPGRETGRHPFAGRRKAL